MKKTHATFATLLAIGLAASLSNSALADGHPVRKNVNAREHHQHDRIKQGVRSGELTRTEAKGLITQQRDIRKEEREYRADGKFTREERKDVQQDLNAASKDIYQEKHDAEKRP